MSEGNAEFHQLLQRVNERDPDAVDEFVANYRGELYWVIRRRLHQRLRSLFDSVDFLQSVWADFFAIPADQLKFASPSDLRAFLLDMAAHKLIDTFRRHFQCQRRNLNREHSLDGSARTVAQALTGQDPTPSQDAIAQETWEKLVQGLPHASQTVLTMLHEGRSHREIARALSVNERTVSRLVRNMKKLRPIP
jgi:RNA polymerase sigma factor (sigma-70 family)